MQAKLSSPISRKQVSIYMKFQYPKDKSIFFVTDDICDVRKIMPHKKYYLWNMYFLDLLAKTSANINHS